MLFSTKEHLFLSDSFKPVLDNKNLFLNMKQAEVRFSGMARGALFEAKRLFKRDNKTSKEANDLNKNMAKSLQFLFSLDNLLNTQTHSPVLPEKQRLEVLNVKKGNVSFEKVLERHAELTLVLEKTLSNTKVLEKTEDRETLNKVLSKLVLEHE